MTLRIVSTSKDTAVSDESWRLLMELAASNSCLVIRGPDDTTYDLLNGVLMIACPDGRCIEISWNAKTGLQIASISAGSKP